MDPGSTPMSPQSFHMIALSEGHHAVYHLSFLNGKGYIGVTTDLKRRLWEHEHRDTLAGRASRKYGTPKLQVLAVCLGEYAYELERKAVAAFKTLHPDGYNLMDGGVGGRKMSAATRQKMSESHTGFTMPPETRQKVSETRIGLRLKPWLGRLHSAATKRKMAESQRGKRHSVETREKISKSKTGVSIGPMSDETRRKISEGQRRAHARRRVK